MKKVAVMVLLIALNIGAMAQEIIFSADFESGWPNAWAQSVGWSAFVVKDSTGKLVGPVVDWTDTEQTPIVATWIDGEKVLFRVRKERLFLLKNVYFAGPNCTGQAYVCYSRCRSQGAGSGSISEDAYTANVEMEGVAYGLGENGVLFRGSAPAEQDVEWESFVPDYPRPSGWTCEAPPGVETLRRAYPAQPVVDLNTLFIPPFSVE